jgi:hypothetical protein
MNNHKGKARPNTSKQITTVVTRGNNNTRTQSKRTKNTKQRSKPIRQVSRPSNNGGQALTTSYLKSLVNPFQYSGPRLGWGCMVPSTVETAYVRGVITANADGTCALVALPCQAQMLSAYTSGNTSTVTTTTSATDSTSIAANYFSGRPISLGIRAFPSIPATSAPGLCYTGAIPASRAFDVLSVGGTSSVATSDYFTFPETHINIGSNGGSSTGRPQDTTSMQFRQETVSGNGYQAFVSTLSSLNSTSLQDMNFSLPFVAFAGLPASATIAFEVVFNFEGIIASSHNGGAMQIAQGASPTLCDYWNSFETMYRNISSLLPPPGRPGESAADVDSSALVRSNGSRSSNRPTTLGGQIINFAYNSALSYLSR